MMKMTTNRSRLTLCGLTTATFAGLVLLGAAHGDVEADLAPAQIGESAPAELSRVIRPTLQDVLARHAEDEFIPVTIVLKEQVSRHAVDAVRRNSPRAERRSRVVQTLKQKAEQSSAGVVGALEAERQQGGIDGRIRALWLHNVVAVRATPSVIRSIAARPDVEAINYDRPAGEEVLLGGAGSSPPTCGVELVGAPDVWNDLGITGNNVVVGVIDTGTCVWHPDLADRIWQNPGETLDGTDTDGNGYVDDLHGWNFQHDNNDLTDTNSHGTHVAGTVMGTGADGTQTGVAPGAQLMTLKFWNSLSGESTVWEATQYGVENGADILTASLGWMAGWDPDKVTWRTIVENAMAAGVVVLYAAGNEGSCCPPTDSVRTPGNVPDVITVGSTDCGLALSSSSSVGPVTWENVAPFNDWAYPPGKLKPTITAPGVDVWSTSNAGWQQSQCSQYGLNSGTSMATPHVAGIAALMLEANPQLDHFDVKSILKETAIDLGWPGADNQYGAGFVDAYAAVEAALDLVGPASDLNNDGAVDIADLLILLGEWGECPGEGACPADLNGDGMVNVVDLLQLLAEWG